MDIISLRESDHYLETWGYRSFDKLQTEVGSGNGLSFPIPQDCGRKLALCRFLVRGVIGNLRSATYVFDQEVFGSPESVFLFRMARRGLGDDRPLEESPVYLASGEESQLELITVMAMVEFLMMSYITVTEGAGVTIYVSHDEYVNLQISDALKASQVKSDFEDISRLWP